MHDFRKPGSIYDGPDISPGFRLPERIYDELETSPNFEQPEHFYDGVEISPSPTTQSSSDFKRLQRRQICHGLLDLQHLGRDKGTGISDDYFLHKRKPGA